MNARAKHEWTRRPQAGTDLLGPMYPHAGGCAGCRVERRCNYCGVELKQGERCTNGRCSTCHRSICTAGGATEPGHGYGRQG